MAFGELLFERKKINYSSILMYVVVAILIVLIFFYYFFGCAVVLGQSMENTLKNGQRCVLLKHGYTVERGDIVTIEHPNPKKDGEMLIKRVIALGGDKILYVRSDGNKYVDMYVCKSGETHFKLANEKYLKEERMNYDVGELNSKFKDKNGNIIPTAMYHAQEVIESIGIDGENLDYDQKLILDCVITVPKGYIYYLGDNRNHSSDSRYYGPCKTSAVTGKIIEISEKGSMLEDFLNFMFST